MKKIIIAISFLAFMVSCSSGGEQQPTDPDMDATVAQDDSVYKEDSGDASEETASADNSLEAGLALIEGSDCRTCHQNDTRVIGPSYKEVAEKYSRSEEHTSELQSRGHLV